MLSAAESGRRPGGRGADDAVSAPLDMASVGAYLPQDRRHELATGRRLPERSWGAVLFVDIAGFTPLTEALTRTFGPHRGSELLTQQLNAVYTALISQVDSCGGSVIGFSGDAITCWFAGEEATAALAADVPQEQMPAPTLAFSAAATDAYTRGAAQAAVTCAYAIQGAMRAFAAFTVTPGVAAQLAVKTVVAAGPVRRYVVGDPAIQLIDVLAGATLDRMAAAEQLARQGEIVVDQLAAAALAPELMVSAWRGVGEEAVAVLGAAPLWVASWLARPATAPAATAACGQLALADDLVRPWLLPAVHARLQSGQQHYLAELRPAAALFLKFSGLEYDYDEQAGAKLDTFVRWVQHVVDRYEGAVIQLTTGDKGAYLYAAFGAPVAHDDDPVRAAAAACELRTVPAQLAAVSAVAIGLSQGMMRTGAYGSATRQTYGVLGDETNMAARLMSQAGPGQVLVSQAMARRIEERFALEALGTRKFKGKAEPQPVFALAEPRVQSPAHLSAVHRTALVGRQREIAQLQELLRAACAGAGQVASIEGEAGAGKTHLAAHFARTAAATDLTVVAVFCQSTDQSTAYFAGRQLARAVAGLVAISTEPPAAQVACLAANLSDWNPAWLPRLPLLAELVGLSVPDTPTTAALDARQRQEALISLVVDLTLYAARRRPLLLLVEDAHWLDEASKGMFLALSRALAVEPICLVFVQRPPVGERDSFGAAVAALPHQTLVQLAELDQAATAALVQARLAGEIDDLALAFVLRQAQGNPFFTEELVDALRESGHLQAAGAQWQLAPALVEALRMANCLERTGDLWRLAPDAPLSALNLGVPSSIHGLVLSRVDRLPEAAKFTLKVASVIGRIFALDLLTAVHPAAPELATVHDQFSLFQARDFARLETPQPRPVYIFKHNITQEVVYRTLLETQQRSLHLAVAQALEAQHPEAVEQLAHHYQHSDLTEPAVRARALHFLDAAARRARHDYANETALAYYDRALALETRCAWLQGKVETLHILGRREEETAALTALAAAAGPEAASRISIGLLRIDYAEAIGDYAGAQRWIASTQALARQQADWVSVATCLNRAGIIAWRQGDYGAAESAYQEALLCAQSRGLPAAESEARYGLGLVFRQQGRLEEARQEFEHDLALNRQLGNRQNEARALNALGSVADLQRDDARALDTYRQALAIRESIGDRAGVGVSLYHVALVLRKLGDHSQAEPLLRSALKIQQGIGNRWDVLLIYNELGILYLTVGEYDQARACLEQGVADSRVIGSEFAEAYLLCNLGQLCRDAGEYAAAVANLLASLAMAQAQGDAELEAICEGDLAQTYLRTGEYALALTAAAQSLALYTALEQPLATTSVLATQALAALALGQRAEAQAAALHALAILDGCAGEGPDFPHRDYWLCGQALAALGEREVAQRARLRAHDLLLQRAARISDAALRRSYLENVLIHREIAAYRG